MKKRIFFILSALLAFAFCSCASEQKLYTSGSSTEQIIFVRPVEQKLKQSPLNEISFDIKVDYNGTVVTKDPVVNYSMTTGKTDFRKFENAVLCFEADGKLLETKNHVVLFRDVVNSKQMRIRISSEISADDFYEIIDSESSVTVKLVNDGQVCAEFISSDFEDKLFDLRLVL